MMAFAAQFIISEGESLPLLLCAQILNVSVSSIAHVNSLLAT